MSTQAVTQIVNRSMTDEAFLDKFLTAPQKAIEGYDLTRDEKAILLRGECEEILLAAGRTDRAKWIIVPLAHSHPN